MLEPGDSLLIQQEVGKHVLEKVLFFFQIMGKVKRARQKAHTAAVKVKQDKSFVNKDEVEVVEMNPDLVILFALSNLFVFQAFSTTKYTNVIDDRVSRF